MLYPDKVHLNRGNHEQKRLNEKYGFAYEARKKYDKDLFEMIAQTFWCLPLCTVVDKKILVLHGGLFYRDGIRLDHIH
jgi:hypothetical protein